MKNVSGTKDTRDKFFLKRLQSPVIMASSLKKKQNQKLVLQHFLSSYLHGFCDRLKLLLQHKQAGIIFNIIIEEIVAISDNLQKYRSISTKQHRLLLLECSN